MPDRVADGAAVLDRIAALPAGLFERCGACDRVVHRETLARRLRTCPCCGHYFRLGSAERIASLADERSFTELHRQLRSADPLEFTDRLPYTDRLAGAEEKTGLGEAAVAGTATIAGCPVVLVVLDFAFLGGSMGSVVGEKIARSAESAAERGVPLVVVSASGGARMQEGALSLVQMAKCAAAIGRLRAAGVPYVSVLTDPVYGGVAASFAALGDVIVAERGTRAGFAGPRVIEQTIGQRLPTGFQTAEFLHEHGHVDLVCARPELPAVVGALVRLLSADADPPATGGSTAPVAEQTAAELDGWAAVGAARNPGRPSVTEHLELIFDELLELHGDRWIEDDPAVVAGVGRLGDRVVVFAGHRKGRGLEENSRCNFGMPHPSGYRKVHRLYRLAERLALPVVTLIDTPGAYPGLRAEEENQSAAIAELLALGAGLRVPVISVVTGEGGSGGALALAVADKLLIQEHAIFSVISPEGAAAILFGDAERAADAARALRLRANDLLRLGVVDEVLPEHPGDARASSAVIAAAVSRHLRELTALDPADLLDRRYRRIRSHGSNAVRQTAEIEGN
ncbi:acetyl-CoA carboxylase, carboxyltransferase subunit beta [Amycolatopsis sp. YIM 10]|uniref:acetyl-CoA carboxylase, carboxyltransferase subunit beta n=1 Tax=Amycolatopsis sp. YIM 10 TaxID=2653857 RepID=UPI001290772F|nr:acetyl-CoA carboxylase, carboxyltransferase subunit beta [Amycolatopsis sp. YIM 10]QFU90543.1 Acetyl-coenzyme A carboxylase carboxyl transferase subunit beta [Amycolatopsis sp. YIM 10]